jgi:hypothetical protein
MFARLDPDVVSNVGCKLLTCRSLGRFASFCCGLVELVACCISFALDRWEHRDSRLRTGQGAQGRRVASASRTRASAAGVIVVGGGEGRIPGSGSRYHRDRRCMPPAAVDRGNAWVAAA